MKQKPILTARQIVGKAALALGEATRITCDYTVDGIPYTGKFRVTLSAENIFVACPNCGCSVRQLFRIDGRPGLSCRDCLSKHERQERHEVVEEVEAA